MLWETIVGVLAAFGFISLLSVLADTLLYPLKKEPPVCAVVHMGRDSVRARQAVYLLNRLRRRGQIDLRVVLIDNGIPASDRQELEMMCRQDQTLILCDEPEWEQALERIVSGKQTL